MKNHRSSIIERLLALTDANALKNNAENAFANQVREFIDEIPGGFFIYSADKDEKILYANRELLNIFKCKTFQEFQTLTGGSFRGLVHPEELEEVEKSIAKQISERADGLDYVEYRIVCKDGTVRHVEDYGHFAHTESGDVFYVFLSDATEKITKRLAERLQWLEVIEGLSINYDSILYYDPENDAVLPYRLSSRTKEQFRKYPDGKGFERIMKDYIASWVHPDDRSSVADHLSRTYMHQVLTDNPSYYFNYRCIENGETIRLQLRIANVGKEKTAHKFVLGFRRVDEEILREIKQKQVLEGALRTANLANVAKNAFLANMSHDMRTPLNAIFGFTRLAKQNLSNGGDVGYYLDRIEEAGNEILELTKKVLEASETQTQDFILNETPCDLVKLLEDFSDWAKTVAEKRNLQVSLNTDNIEHRKVLADPDKISDVLGALLSNAVKYNRINGKIGIKATEKTNGTGHLRIYEISVSDTGIGISPDAVERIFAPFEREKDTTESGISGVGLGLTIAKHNAEMMGGNLTFESVKGRGSTFTLTLNLNLCESDESDESDNIPEDLTGLKILLVEDNEINLEIASEMLQSAGYTVDTAENGKIAVDKIRRSPAGTYDVVLMDIQMPVMDGRTATDEIRALGGERSKIPVIALSANAFERDKKLSMEHGMNAHLTKPMELELIQRTIADILKNK